MNLASTGAKNRPALDESSFQQLLAAAYVVQQHNDGQRSRNPALATSGVLAEISEIQARIRAGSLDLNGAAQLTAERLQKITHCSGVNVSLLTDGAWESIAHTGLLLPDSQTLLTAYSFSIIERLKKGELFRSTDTARDISLNSTACQSANVRSLLAAGIARFDEFFGVIEARWSRANAFNESDVRACQLMAVLISGILERNARALERKPVITDSLPIRVIEEAQRTEPESPEISGHSSLSQDPLPPSPAVPDEIQPEGFDDSFHAESTPSALPDYCRVCGRPFGAHEAFCGQCSMPRVAGAGADDLQSKWASLWYMQKAQDSRPERPPIPSTQRADNLPAPAPRSQTISEPAKAAVPPIQESPPARVWHVTEPKHVVEPKYRDPSPVTPEPPVNSKASASPRPPALVTHQAFAVRNYSSPLTSPTVEDESENSDLLQRTWHTVWLRMRRRHAMFAVSAVSVLLLFLVLAVWPAGGNTQLTLFQSLLVELGLAEVPSHPAVLAGNPDTRVWVDVHTALYYCPGSDLYGKTPGGHFASQRDAQQDEFEPASRIACP